MTSSDPYTSVDFLPDELGNLVHPLHYDIHLIFPQLSSCENAFEGYSAALVLVTKETSVIAIHSDPRFLHIRSIAVCNFSTPAPQTWHPIPSTSWRSGLGVEAHVFEFQLPHKVCPGEYLKLLFLFEGLMSSSPQGLYGIRYLAEDQPWFLHGLSASSDGSSDEGFLRMEECNLYKKQSGVTTFRAVASSLEPLFARRVFPCFDSLHFKATFSLAISIPPAVSSLSLPPLQVISSTPQTYEVVSAHPPLFPCAKNFAVIKTSQIGAEYVPEWLEFPVTVPRPSELPISDKQPNPPTKLTKKRSWKSCCFPCCSSAKEPQTDAINSVHRASIDASQSTSKSFSKKTSKNSSNAGTNIVSRSTLSASKTTLSTSKSSLSSSLSTGLPPLPTANKIRKNSGPQYLQRSMDTKALELEEEEDQNGTFLRLERSRFVQRASVLTELFTSQIVTPLLAKQLPTLQPTNVELPTLQTAEDTIQSSRVVGDFVDEVRDLIDEEQFTPRATPTSIVTMTSRADSKKEAEDPKQEAEEQYITYLFDTTPFLPCYALGLFIGHFVRFPRHHTAPDGDERKGFSPKKKWRVSDESSEKSIEITALTITRVKEDSAAFSVFVTKQCLTNLGERWRAIPYPISKLDLIALPHHRGLGLENFGCITFDDRYFFVDENTHRRRALRVARLVCHEVAHMWLGDLLSPASFDQLWMKEGFARFVEYKVLLDIFASSNSLPLNTFKDCPDLEDLLLHFQFTSSDVWGSFILEVYWDAIAADCPNLEHLLSPQALVLGTDDLYHSEPPVDISHGGQVTPKGFMVDEAVASTSPPMKASNKAESNASPASRLSEDSAAESHPIQLKGLLKTSEITNKFDSITYGKAACVLHSLAEFIGGWPVFSEVIHEILRLKCDPNCGPGAALVRNSLVDFGIVRPEDLWGGVGSQKIKARVEEGGDEVEITSDEIQKLYEPWFLKQGFPRLNVWLDATRSQEEEGEIIFVTHLYIHQLPPPDKSAPFTLPLRVIINSKTFDLILKDQEVKIPIVQTPTEMAEGGLDDFSLTFNDTAKAFCTIHPKTNVTWKAMFNAIRSPPNSTEDCDVSLILITILEHAKFEAFNTHTNTNRRKTPRSLLQNTVQRLFDLYTSLDERIRAQRKRENKKIFISATSLSVLHIILSLFSCVAKLSSRAPQLNEAQLIALRNCTGWLALPLFQMSSIPSHLFSQPEAKQSFRQSSSNCSDTSTTGVQNGNQQNLSQGSQQVRKAGSPTLAASVFCSAPTFGDKQLTGDELLRALKLWGVAAPNSLLHGRMLIATLIDFDF